MTLAADVVNCRLMANSSKRYWKWQTLLITILVSGGIGFYLGKMDLGSGEDTDQQTTEQGQSGQQDEQSAQAGESADKKTGRQADGAAAEKPAGLSTEELAKEKDVPEKVKSAQGDFSLVDVIEGDDANRSLLNSLQVVNGQRQRLAQLSSKFDQTNPELVQQRELVAGQINETRKSLEQNLRFMAQNFGYVISNNYLLVPHRATLNSVVGSGKDQIKTVVYTFENSESYQKFQEKTDAYTKLKIDQVKAYRATQSEAEQKQPLPKMPLTEAMEKARKEMIDKYKCDPERSYLMEIQKAALYARKAQ